MTVAWYETPELVETLYQHHYRMAMRQVEMVIDSHAFDYLTLGGSGSITLASPELFDRFALPFIKEATHLCAQAGLPTMLHSCGKETHLVRRVAEETDLNCVNPLEVPPMGDCDLAALKRQYGHKLALMGNLHTTEVMLRGTVDEVKAAARKAIDDAGAGGGFILSTGDQCGRGHPRRESFRAGRGVRDVRTLCLKQDRCFVPWCALLGGNETPRQVDKTY